MQYRWRVIGVVVIVIATLAGCGEETGGRLPVSGTIKLKGQPVANGSIFFESEPPASGVFTGGPITDGKYELKASQGLLPGKYIVRISVPESTAQPAEPGGEPGPPVNDLVPPEYNVQSKLRYEAKAGSSNFDYDVP
jgi:hypothetical protein